MSKAFYTVIRHDLEGNHEFVAVTSLLKSEEEANKELLDVVREDLDGLDLDEDFMLDKADEQLSEGDYVDLSDFGLAYVYKVIEIDVKSKKELTQFDWTMDYNDWYDRFEKTLRIPKVKGYYPREFCMGILSSISPYDPRLWLDKLGFDDYVLPIDWEEFFITGHTEFEDIDHTKIVFDFKLETGDDWIAELTVCIDGQIHYYEEEILFDEGLSKAAKYKKVSFELGRGFELLLISWHPLLEEYDR